MVVSSLWRLQQVNQRLIMEQQSPPPCPDIDVVDTVLGIGSMFDFISPLQQMTERLADPWLESIRFWIPAGYSGLEIQRYLEDNGVWVGGGCMIVNGQAVINVDDPDRAWYVLYRLLGIWCN